MIGQNFTIPPRIPSEYYSGIIEEVAFPEPELMEVIIEPKKEGKPKIINPNETSHTLGSYWRKIESPLRNKKSSSTVLKINISKKPKVAKPPKKVTQINNNAIAIKPQKFETKDDAEDFAFDQLQVANKKYEVEKDYLEAAKIYGGILDVVKRVEVKCTDRQTLHNYLYYCYLSASKSEESITEKQEFIAFAEMHLGDFLKLQNGFKNPEKIATLSNFRIEVIEFAFNLFISQKFEESFDSYKLALELALKNKQYVNFLFDQIVAEGLDNLMECIEALSKDKVLCIALHQELTDLVQQAQENGSIPEDLCEKTFNRLKEFYCKNFGIDESPEEMFVSFIELAKKRIRETGESLDISSTKKTKVDL